MKTSVTKSKFTERYEPAPTIHTPGLPHNFEQIHERARKIYAARGGMTGMTLNDWLMAEQAVKRECSQQTKPADKP